VSKAAVSRKSPRQTPATEADKFYAGIRHKRAAQTWRGLNRNVSATAKQLGVDRSTVQDWRDKEGWVRWADAADGKVAAQLQVVHESAVEKHLKDLDTLLSTGRAIVGQAEKEILNRLLQGHSVDMIEVRQLTGAIKALVDAGAIHFNLKTLNIKHGGEIQVNHADLEDIRKRLAGKVPGLKVLDYGAAKSSRK
jgi:hypothetical protein